ncbi:MAG TPA: AtpZ/AtpI family protein [Beijerinckiaceae bacterium]|jgi:ATP synthase protein I|nr:AtpZ/AtpI family protein [Beijerinckiaceae bacterium]
MATNDGGQGPGDRHDREDRERREREEADLRARMNALSAKIDAQRHRPAAGGEPETAASQRGWGQAMNLGFRVVTELVAGILVGGGIGYLLDKWLGTKPFLLILFGLLGTAGGFWNIIRATSMPMSGPPPR